MSSSAPILLRGLICAALCTSLGSQAIAQRYKLVDPGSRGAAKRDSKTTTLVNVELLTGKENVALQAQQWGRLFQKLGLPIRIRSAIGDEQPEIRQKVTGSVRRVTAIGHIHRSGQLIFPEKKFSFDQTTQLAEWLKSLENYGAQGSPEGRPLWGLNEQQFGKAYAALSQKLDQTVHGAELEAGLKGFELERELPVRLSDDAKTWLEREFDEVPKVGQELKGFSKGTALAILLSAYNLAFYPTRTPDGQLEAVVVPAGSTTEIWPVGWELKASRGKTAPKLFQMVPVEFDDVPVLDLLSVISERTSVPIRLDEYRIKEHGVDLTRARVSHPRKNSALEAVVLRAVAESDLRSPLRIDERGQPFLWITTVEGARARR